MPDIRAAVLHEIDGEMVIERVVLAPPGPGEVLVRMVAAGVCHSDLHVVKGHLRHRLPVVLGHEGAGVVEAVGEGVESVEPGTPVVLMWIPSCGHCPYCASDQTHLCENGDPLGKSSRISLDGESVNHFLSTSAFSEYVVVAESGVLPVDEEMPLERAALVSCGVVTGVGAVLNAARVPPGATVAVFGCGGVGLNVLQGARLADAERVIAIDRVPDKLELAGRFGATDTLDVSDSEMNVVEALRAVTDGRGVDYAFDAVGDARVFKQAYAALRKGGTAVLVGLPPYDEKLEIRGLSLVLQEKAVIGSYYGSMSPREHIPLLLKYHREGNLLLDELVSHRFALDEVNQAFDALERGDLTRGIIEFGE
jgi:Zn-dependent alcohol dehydrogenase